MFDPRSENSDNWQDEIRNDVLDECRKHGGALHVHVDKLSEGNVYVKCTSVAAAVACVGALHGRWFSGQFRLFTIVFIDSPVCLFFSMTGRLVTAAYVPVTSYHTLFPESINATTPL